MHSTSSGPTTASGPPLVLVHGLGMSSRYLVPTLDLLAAHHRVLAPDLPGCGRSGRPDHPLHVAELADAVLAWMDVVGLERPVLVGHSIGSQVVTDLAARHPDRAADVVLASPTGDPATGRWRQGLQLLGGSAREAPALVPIALRDYLRAGPWRMWRTLGHALDEDTVARLQRLRSRCLVVRGEHDAVVAPAWAADVAATARAELVTIPDAPHGLPFSAPGPFAGAVDRFLRARPPGGC